VKFKTGRESLSSAPGLLVGTLAEAWLVLAHQLFSSVENIS
jgi:hypothetical protein